MWQWFKENATPLGLLLGTLSIIFSFLLDTSYKILIAVIDKQIENKIEMRIEGIENTMTIDRRDIDTSITNITNINKWINESLLTRLDAIEKNKKDQTK